MKRLITIILIAISGISQAQDPFFTQFYASPIYLNPAFAGSARCPRIALNYRNQWPGFDKTYITYSASYDQHVDFLSGGVGLNILNDKAGNNTISTTNVSGIYAYNLNIARDFSIRVGLQATYVQKHLDWDKIYFGDQIDPRYGFVYPTQEVPPDLTTSFPDFSAGLLAYSSSFYGGVAVFHLTEPDEAFIVKGTSPLPRRITAHIGAMVPLGTSSDYKYFLTHGDGTYLSPNAIFQQQGATNYLNLGAYILHSPIIGGIWYKANMSDGFKSESVTALIGIQKGLMKFGYSYDVTISRLGHSSTLGAHEISFGMQFECRPKKKKFRTISCPSF